MPGQNYADYCPECDSDSVAYKHFRFVPETGTKIFTLYCRECGCSWEEEE